MKPIKVTKSYYEKVSEEVYDRLAWFVVLAGILPGFYTLTIEPIGEELRWSK